MSKQYFKELIKHGRYQTYEDQFRVDFLDYKVFSLVINDVRFSMRTLPDIVQLMTFRICDIYSAAILDNLIPRELDQVYD